MMASGDDMIFHGGGPDPLLPFSGTAHVKNGLRFKIQQLYTGDVYFSKCCYYNF